jgi:transcriptional regulator with XRE-family HTH domain
MADEFPLGMRLKDLRQRDRLTLDDVANDVGITAAHLSAIENDKIPNPGYKVVVALSRFYGLSVSSMLGERATHDWPLEVERIATRLANDLEPAELDFFATVLQVHLQKKRETKEQRAREQKTLLSTIVSSKPGSMRKRS